MTKELSETISDYVRQYREGSISKAMLIGWVEDVIGDDDDRLKQVQIGTRWGWIWAEDTVDWISRE